MRERARKAFVATDNCQTFRRAMFQRSRPERTRYYQGDAVMMWKRRGEADGNWVGPLRVVLHEDQHVVWLTMGTKLFRVAPEHVRPLSAVEEFNNRTQLASTPNYQSIVPPHGGIQYHNQVTINPESNVDRNLNTPAAPITSTIPEVVPNQAPIPIPESNQSDQPDTEPGPEVNTSNNSEIEPPTINPVDVPIPTDIDDDELFVDDEVAWHVSEEQCWRFEIDVSAHDIASWRAEERPHEMAFVVSAAKRQRSEVKLTQLSESDRKLFQQAKEKEINSWISTETITKILRHKLPRENILRSRWILTWKEVDPEKNTGQVAAKFKPKARLVVLGFEDPQVDNIPRDSPTMNKLSRMLVLQMAASQKWTIQSFDVQTAFLRGREQNQRMLGMEPPEEMRKLMKLKQEEVVQLLKGAYGRVDAPYLWFAEFKRTLEEIGFESSPFDPCLFILTNPHTHATEGLIGVHVDDGLCCGSPMFQAKLKQLESRFPFGSQKQKEFIFTGLRISQKDDYSIEIDQTQYVKDVAAITITRERRARPDDVVTEDERQSLRAVIGSLQYAAVNTRPDLCSRLGYLQSQINRAKVSTLIEANRTLHEAKQFSDVNIKIKSINVADLRFVAFSDASFASEKCHDSHQGMIIMAAHKSIGENQRSPINPIAWHSKKIQKVAVSTLSAEAMALAGTVDMLSWVRLVWAWLCDHRCNWREADQTLLQLPPAYAALAPESHEQEKNTPQIIHQLAQKLPKHHQAIITTDCKSLYDLISRTAPPACGEFRTQLQTKLIKEHISNGIQIRWVPSAAQMADALTKVMDNSILRQCLHKGFYSLHDEQEILKARSDARSRLKWFQQQAQTESTNIHGETLEKPSRPMY